MQPAGEQMKVWSDVCGIGRATSHAPVSAPRLQKLGRQLVSQMLSLASFNWRSSGRGVKTAPPSNKPTTAGDRSPRDNRRKFDSPPKLVALETQVLLLVRALVEHAVVRGDVAAKAGRPHYYKHPEDKVEKEVRNEQIVAKTGVRTIDAETLAGQLCYCIKVVFSSPGVSLRRPC